MNKNKFAEMLNKNLPKSEQWFQSMWRNEGFTYDQYNKVLGRKILNVLNRKYKYVIEIDGSIHDTYYQLNKDHHKDEYYSNCGYVVIRVKAYSQDSYNWCKKLVIQIREYHDKTKMPVKLKKVKARLLANKAKATDT